MRIKKIYFLFFLLTFSLFGQTENTTCVHIPDSPEEIRSIAVDFKDNFKSTEYIYEFEPSFLTKLKFWILSMIAEWLSVNSEKSISIFNNITTILYTLIIIIAIYIIAKMILNKNGTWGFWKRSDQSSLTINYEENDEIGSLDFNKLIQESVLAENYRLAIRYYYLLLLKQLNEVSLINYDPQKTNIDYQLEMENSKHFLDFKTTSYYHTYTWYGEFDIDKNEYNTMASAYSNLLKIITK